MRIADHSWDMTSGSPFLTLSGMVPGIDVVLKLEGLNPAGSIKLKAAREMVLDAERRGLLRPGSRLIESTSGNLGVALAMVAAARGYSITLVTDPNANERSIRHMRALGAHVVTVEERDANGGYLQRRIDHIHAQLAEDPGLVWLNQYANPAHPQAHRRHTITEILRWCGEPPDWLFVGAGTTGTLMGCVQGLRDHGARTRVVAVDTAGSVTFGTPPATRRIPGLGTSRRPELFTDAPGLIKVLVPEIDAIRACRRTATERGLLVGGSTGSVLAAVLGSADRIPPGDRVVAISPDLGDGYLDTVYDDAWVCRHFGPEALDPAVPPSPQFLDDHLALEGNAHAGILGDRWPGRVGGAGGS